MNQAVLNEILNVLELGAQAVKRVGGSIGNPDVQAGAGIAELLLAIAQKAVAAVEAHQGQPIDLSLLHPIDPVV